MTIELSGRVRASGRERVYSEGKRRKGVTFICGGQVGSLTFVEYQKIELHTRRKQIARRCRTVNNRWNEIAAPSSEAFLSVLIDTLPHIALEKTHCDVVNICFSGAPE